MVEKFLSLEQVSVRMGGRLLLDNLDLTINRAEQWVISGPSGSGKTVLAQTLAGRHYHTGQIDIMTGRVVLVEQQHRFKNRPGATDLYYQQRFNSSDADQTITVEQELREYTVMEGPAAAAWLDSLHIRPLLSRPLIQLSNGENKRVQLAIALLEEPELLILDNPFLGLDTAGRKLLHEIINGLAAKGIQVLLLMTGMQELPAAMTHVARLESGCWLFRGKKEDYQAEESTGMGICLDPAVLAELKALRENGAVGNRSGQDSTERRRDNAETEVLRSGKGDRPGMKTNGEKGNVSLQMEDGDVEMNAGIHAATNTDGPIQMKIGDDAAANADGDAEMKAGDDAATNTDGPIQMKIGDDTAANADGEAEMNKDAGAGGDFPIAIKMVDVTVKYGEKTLLKDINWEVKQGERWNVSGPNGAGKSTLLSLITADNPQAYANEIWLFGRRRGSGETIWEIKKRIGFVSPELHLYFDYSANCFGVIASGLFDTIGLFRALTKQQEANVLLWMKLLSLTELRSKRLAELSTGQQRMVLLARALIKNPPLLILDEPCQGLDEEQTAYFREFINLLCEAFGTTLIYVSHYPQEIPACVNQYLQLENGEMVK